jgi:hypothetical protein
VVGCWQECFSLQRISAQQAMCGSVHYDDTETIVFATSSELHHANSAKLACRNNQ